MFCLKTSCHLNSTWHMNWKKIDISALNFTCIQVKPITSPLNRIAGLQTLVFYQWFPQNQVKQHNPDIQGSKDTQTKCNFFVTTIN